MGDIIPATTIVTTKSVQGYLQTIRPHWKAKSLIQRVEKHLPVDPGSACQRLLNAALHDLRDKVVLAGLDIAKEAADIHKLPPVGKAEDVENYSNDKIIDLAYRMGLLNRAAWRRIKRCYEIRRDLEHEDDEYEAELQDCVYIFATCIEEVLSQDPVQLLRVNDVKEVVEQPKPQFPGHQFLDDYRNAPDPRQKQIMFFLVTTALDPKQPEVVRSNSFEMIKHLRDATRDSIRIELATHLQNKIGRNLADLATMKVAHAAGVTPYLKKNTRNDYFTDYLTRLRKISHHWKSHSDHGPILGELEDIGGLTNCEDAEAKRGILKWMVLCYVGEPGGYGYHGSGRAVFYSDTAAPIIKRIVERSTAKEVVILKELSNSKTVKAVFARGQQIAKRYEDMLDHAGDI